MFYCNGVQRTLRVILPYYTISTLCTRAFIRTLVNVQIQPTYAYEVVTPQALASVVMHVVSKHSAADSVKMSP